MSQWCKQSTGWSVRWSTGKLIAETERRAVSGSLSNTVSQVSRWFYWKAKSGLVGEVIGKTTCGC